MLVLNLVGPCLSKAEYILTMMNEELLAASALLVKVAPDWSVLISSWRKVCKL
jgi:hypothetical protein